MAAPGARLAAIIGTEKVVTWFDLDAVELMTVSRSWTPTTARSRWRLAIIDVASQHIADPSVELARGAGPHWPSAASARGRTGAGRSWNKVPATSAWCRT